MVDGGEAVNRKVSDGQRAHDALVPARREIRN